VLPRGNDTSLSTGANNNVALNANTFSRWTSSAAASVTGIVAPASPYANKVLIISNANATVPLQVNNEDVNSTAANRIVTGTSAPITLLAGASLFFVYDDSASRYRVVGGTGSGSSSKFISQAAHGFPLGTWLAFNGSTYVVASNAAVATGAVGVVSLVVDAGSFILTSGGYVSGLSGLVANTTYYLSTAGAASATAPLLGTPVVQQELLRSDSTSSGYVNIGPALVAASGSVDGLVSTVAQSVAGVKTFTVKVIETLGAEIPNVLDNPGAPRTEIIPAGSTRIVGRLAVAANLTIQVDGDLVVLGAITGTGLLTGSGLISSI